MIWEKRDIGLKGYGDVYSCNISPNDELEHVCLSIRSSIEIFQMDDLGSISLYDTITLDDWVSNYNPVLIEGKIFMNPRPGPELTVIDLFAGEKYNLIEYCDVVDHSQMPMNFEDQLLIADGCNDMYTLSLDDLSAPPSWTYHSEDRIVSSFVTLNGVVGYALTRNKEIIGIDLVQGKTVGSMTLLNGNSDPLKNDQLESSLLVTNDNTLVVMLGKNLILSFS